MNTNTTDQDTMIIDYGNSNPVCISYGNIKSGKIIIIYTGKYRDSLSVMTTTFDDYHVNNNLVQGERILTNQGRNNKGNMWFTIEVNNATIGIDNGTINWTATQTREWVSGAGTYFDITDDQYKITGSANGIGVNNNSFTMKIIDTLNVDKNNSKEEAISDIYKVLRPGEPPSVDVANEIFTNLFFKSDRYDLSDVGRVKLNNKLQLDCSDNITILRNDDIIAIIRHMLDLKDGKGDVDDIDHLDSETEYGDTNYERYNIDCWIEWKDYFQTGKNDNQLVTKARKLSTVMSVF